MPPPLSIYHIQQHVSCLPRIQHFSGFRWNFRTFVFSRFVLSYLGFLASLHTVPRCVWAPLWFNKMPSIYDANQK